MRVWLLYLFPLLLSSSLGEDTVAEDIGVHQLERLVELLTSKECDDLLSALSHPEENIFRRLSRLSPENNRLDLKPRVRRDDPSAADGEAQCRTALTDWLLRNGEQIYYDRLSGALQHIGRTDIALEVGKNINQDKALSLKRYVEDYHKYVNTLNLSPVQPEADNHRHADPQAQGRKARALTWRDLDLIVERTPVPPHRRGLLDGGRPLLYGMLLGFGVTLLIGVVIILFIIYVSHGNRLNRVSRGSGSSFYRHRQPSSQSLMAGDGEAASRRPARRSDVTN